MLEIFRFGDFYLIDGAALAWSIVDKLDWYGFITLGLTCTEFSLCLSRYYGDIFPSLGG